MPILEPMTSTMVGPAMRSGLAEGSEDWHVTGCLSSVAQTPRRAAARPFTMAVLSPNLAGSQARALLMLDTPVVWVLRWEHHMPLALNLARTEDPARILPTGKDEVQPDADQGKKSVCSRVM